jgi:hypothetical protein
MGEDCLQFSPLFNSEMKYIKNILPVLCCLMMSLTGQSQQLSSNTVNFNVTYDAIVDQYTAWVVPDYNVPNTTAPINNTASAEYGGTAQFALKVPNSFSITSIQDIKGVWDKAPLRLGPGNVSQTWTGLDPLYNYYVIGKDPSETNYGAFQVGVPVALFTFKAVSCVGPVIPLSVNDPFITSAETQFLNVRGSFYSRSGQAVKGNGLPLEQLIGSVGTPADCRPIAVVPDSKTTAFGQATTVAVLGNDLDKVGAPASLTSVTLPVATQPANGTIVVNADGSITYTPNVGFRGSDSFTYTICDIDNSTKCSTVTVSMLVLPPVSILPKAYLQGALLGVYLPDQLMRDDLRRLGLVPAAHPYSSWSPVTPAGTVTTPVLSTTGSQAVVDWVYVELRNATNSVDVVDSRAALVLRNGDIVDVDGVSSLTFASALPQNYYVVVRHRNHLSVMSQSALPLSNIPLTVDFRQTSTPTFTYSGTTSYTQVTVDQAQVLVDQGVAMWAGNAFNENESTAPHNFVVYQGTNNDLNVIYQQVLNPAGVLVTPYTIRSGYLNGDINLDGKTIFQGTLNDGEFIYQNVIKNHPGNSSELPFFKIREQTP